MESFAIVPGTSRGLWIVVAAVLLVLFIAAGILTATARGSRNSRFEVSDAGLRLAGDLYGRMIPAAELRGGAARIVDLTGTRELQLRRRTLGTAFPGYNAGWFRLRNGEKALVYLTDVRHAVYVPTRQGYSLLLSPQQPERFVERLRLVAPGS
jgi:Bacterial PH domain